MPAESVIDELRTILQPRQNRRLAAYRRFAPEPRLTAWQHPEITPDIRGRAAEPFPTEPVRTLDALHLATALSFARLFPGLPVLTFEERILANLEPLGLANALPRQ